MKYPNPLNLSLKNLKTWNGQEGGGYTFTLYAGDKAVAVVRDDAMGGEINIEGVITDAMRRKQDRALFDKAHNEARVIEQKIRALCKTLPVDHYEGMDLPVSIDMYLGDLLSSYEIEKKMAKHRLKGTLFRLPGDKDTEYRTLTLLDPVKANEWLTKKYGATNYTVI
jgi:hypothetical protein